jgi:hypothetical protein
MQFWLYEQFVWKLLVELEEDVGWLEHVIKLHVDNGVMIPQRIYSRWLKAAIDMDCQTRDLAAMHVVVAMYPQHVNTARILSGGTRHAKRYAWTLSKYYSRKQDSTDLSIQGSKTTTYALCAGCQYYFGLLLAMSTSTSSKLFWTRVYTIARRDFFRTFRKPTLTNSVCNFMTSFDTSIVITSKRYPAGRGMELPDIVDLLKPSQTEESFEEIGLFAFGL